MSQSDSVGDVGSTCVLICRKSSTTMSTTREFHSMNLRGEAKNKRQGSRVRADADPPTHGAGRDRPHWKERVDARKRLEQAALERLLGEAVSRWRDLFERGAGCSALWGLLRVARSQRRSSMRTPRSARRP